MSFEFDVSAPLDTAEQLALLQLRCLPRVGDVRCAALLHDFGSARAALEGLRADGAPADAAGADWAAEQLARCAELGAQFIPIHDRRYPALLRQIPDPPVYLFVRGRAELLNAPGIAIVGSRRCSPYGRDVARRFGRDLAGRGLTVISGLALGIDAAAHEGALEAGDTLSVLGCGADIVYPAANRRLHERILAEGAMVSEFPLGIRPEAGSFPRRNRIISGLSLGVVVAEAPQRSGALITARCAVEQDREVFAIPGEITNRRCAGCLSLLRDGACLARDAQDVIDELWTRLPRHVQTAGGEAVAQAGLAPAPGDASTRLLGLLETGTRQLDSLTRDSGMEPADVLSLMLRLELAGMVEALPGGAYGRRR
jgi:DNA processing protein